MAGAKKKVTAKARKRTHRVRERAVAHATRRESVGMEAPVKKNLRLHQSKIDEARRLLGTRTETETIEVALDLVVFRNELVAGVEAMRGVHLVDLFEGDN